MTIEKAMFAAGCFWGVEHDFKSLNGVIKTTVGYSGGSMINPKYEDVCKGETGHAEVVEIEFDSSIISYSDLVEKFWTLHDPTTLNRQGPDVGTQYRSAIYIYNDEQKNLAESSKNKLDNSGKYLSPIVTEITKAEEFFSAEEYHQDYFEKKTCHI